MCPNVQPDVCYPHSVLLGMPKVEGSTVMPRMKAEGAVPAGQCDPSLTGDAKESCHGYTKLSNMFGTVDGLLIAGIGLSYDHLPKKYADDVYTSIKVLYTLIADGNTELINAIGEVNEGKPYTPIETAAVIPAFPPVPTEISKLGSAIEGVWAVVHGVLTQVKFKKQEGPLFVAMMGIINNGGDTVKAIVDTLNHQ
ncbi:hypothetical protein KIPB_002458 [Kipferlia bialata]|uniref:Uncharacterized protein n=1 Tax=Kipferlia bialata TaxID=797122 RepID=A0A391NME1_9EUKA|nr:hypothetical protein KIPB_002458 [Kipferlia bialata]|eukprot:g2458.t1